MTILDPIYLWLAASIATGVIVHATVAVRDRRAYHRLRDGYVTAVSEVQQTGASDALVRAHELHREFMRVAQPRWFAGLGARLKAVLAVCAIAGVAMMVATGRLSPTVAGVAALFAIGLRRILLATALLLALFATTSVVAPPAPADRTSPAHHSAPLHSAKPPARSR